MSLEPDPSPAAEQSTRGLVARLLAGDRAAADALFLVHRERLRRAIRAHLGAEQRAQLDEDDLLQRTLLRAFASIDRFEWRGQGAFLAWIKRIAIRELCRELEARRSSPRAAPAPSESGAGQSPISALASREPSPSDALARREEQDVLERALSRLPDEERHVLINRQILGQDYDSLAAELGITRGAARMKVSRAMAQVARWVEEGA